MTKICERKLFLTAWQYCEEHHPDELEWAKGVNKDTFKNIKPEEFLRNYFWVLCNGHKLGFFDQIFLILASVMKDCDIAQLITKQLRDLISDLMCRQRIFYDFSLDSNSHYDLHYFFEGAKMIFDEDFETYKERLNSGGTECRIDALAALPGINLKKSSRLAKNIGLVDTAREKPDIWLERAALECRTISIGRLLDGFSGREIDTLIGKHSSMVQLGEYLSEEFNCSAHVVDFVFWRYGKRALSMYDYASIDKEKGEKLFFTALSYCQKYHPDELEWARGVNEETFKNMKSKEFLRNYCWVVYTGKSNIGEFEQYFTDLETALKDFDITALRKMRSIKPVLNAFDDWSDCSDCGDACDQYEEKTKCFLAGAKMIADEGFETYKKRLEEEGINALEELLDMNWDRSDIARDTKSRLARNIGLTDTIEPDEWLKRAASECAYWPRRRTVKKAMVEELVDYLSKEFNSSRHVVDFVLWRFVVQGGLQDIDFKDDWEYLLWWDC